jgi:hypothetical protein
MLGTVLVAPGVAQFLLAGSGFGMCLALIGWFVRATAAEHQAAVTQRLKGRVTRNAIPAPPATACSWWTVEEFAAQLGAGHAGRRVVPLIDFHRRSGRHCTPDRDSLRCGTVITDFVASLRRAAPRRTGRARGSTTHAPGGLEPVSR